MAYDFGRYGSLSDYVHTLQTTQGPKQVYRGMAPGLAQEIGFYNDSTFGRLGALRNAASALDPANRASLLDTYATSAMGGVAGQATRAGNYLRSQYGDQPGLQAGAALSAINSANNQIGQFRNQLYSPFNLANSYLGQASALGAGNVFQGLPYAMQAMGMGAQQPRSGGFLGTLAGLAGTAFSGGWSPFAHGSSSA